MGDGVSLREDLEAAFEAPESGSTESESAPLPVELVPPPDIEGTEAKTEAPEPPKRARFRNEDDAPAIEKRARTRDETGKFKPAEALSDKTAPKPDGKAPDKPGQGTAQPAALRAPQAWKPDVREKWAAIPPEAQQEIIRREKEAANALRQATEVGQNWNQFQQAVSPYMGMIQSEGSNPIKAVGELLQTAAALRTAPPAHKANIVANLIRNFGVPIDALDQILSGQAPQGQQRAPQQQQAQEFRDPRFDQLISALQAKQQADRAAMLQEIQPEIEEASQKLEFFDDLREDMGDLMDLAHKRGRALNLEQAYRQALAARPDLSGIVEQRAAAKAAMSTNSPTQRARLASSSIRSMPSGIQNGGQQPREDLRSVLEDAWDRMR